MHVAAEIGVSQPALSLAKQHVAVVERYPELQNLTQHAALTMGKELDQLPKGARDQRRAALRDEAAHHGSGHGSRGRGRSKRTPATRRLPDPNRRWFSAAQALWRFCECTSNRAAILALARRWSPETLQRYLAEVRRVQAQLAELEAAFQRIAADAGIPHEAAPQADDDHADGTAADEDAPDREPPAPEGSVQGSDALDPEVPERDVVGNDAGAEPVNAAESGADDMFDDTSDTHTAMSESRLRRPTSSDMGQDPIEAEITADGQPHSEDGSPARRGALIARVTALRAVGCSWRALAAQFNAAGVPTLSGRGSWDGKTLARLCRASESPGAEVTAQGPMGKGTIPGRGTGCARAARI